MVIFGPIRIRMTSSSNPNTRKEKTRQEREETTIKIGQARQYKTGHDRTRQDTQRLDKKQEKTVHDNDKDL